MFKFSTLQNWMSLSYILDVKMASSLTAEQLRRIEENKQRALAKLAKKSKPQTQLNIPTGSSVGSNCKTNFQKYAPQKSGWLHSKQGQSEGSGPTAITSNCNVSTVTKPSSTLPTPTAASNISGLDRAEQNRLKALAKRAEKLNQSPVKSNTGSFVSKPVNSVTGTDNELGTSVPKCEQKVLASFTSNSANFNAQNMKPDLNQQSNRQLLDFQKGPNIFSSFSGKAVKAECVIISRERFEVKAGYSAPLIELFKTMNTKLYGELLYTLE